MSTNQHDTEIVERAAIAAYDEMQRRPHPFRRCGWAELKEETRRAWRKAIISALGTIREPTEAMCQAGRGAASFITGMVPALPQTGTFTLKSDGFGGPREVWRAMLGSALPNPGDAEAQEG